MMQESGHYPQQDQRTMMSLGPPCSASHGNPLAQAQPEAAALNSHG